MALNKLTALDKSRSSVSVFEEDLDLSNEVNLFSAMSFYISLLKGFKKYEYDAFCSSVFKLPILSLILSSVGLINGILEYIILCFDLLYLF